MRRDMEHWPSKAAIVGIVAGVSAYEVLCPEDEFISDEVERIRSHKIGNAVVQAAVWATALHLSGAFKRFGLESIDPLHQLTGLKRLAVKPER